VTDSGATRTRDRRRRAKRFAAAVAVLLFVGLYVGPVRSYLAAKRDARQVRVEVQGLRAEQARLKERLRVARSDAAVIALAREQGFIFPGETPYLVHLPEHAASG
jgi:cell division protein FtsB